MDQDPVVIENCCDYASLKAINKLLQENKFINVRNMIRVMTPFGELLKLDHKACIQNFLTRNAVKAWNGEKLVIENKEYEIDSVLVKKILSLSITGDKIIKPSRDENHVPSFIQEAITQLCKKTRKKFNSHVVAVFQSKGDAEVIAKGDEVTKLSKLYIALIFSALLFPRSKRIPLEYLYLLDDSHFDNLRLYRFDEEVAKFLRDGIQTAKNAKTKYRYVSGCLHIIECLYSQEKLPMIHSQNKGEQQEENEEEMDESTSELDTPFSCKRPRSDAGNCSEKYRLKKEPWSESRKAEVINIDDDSSDEDVNEEDNDEEEEVDDEEDEDEDAATFHQVPKSLFTLKRETMDKAPSSSEYMSPGQLFEGQHRSDCVVLNDGKCEDVGGFSVLKTQAKLYEKIWLRYGHIASNKVLKDSYAQVSVVSGIMTTITNMHRRRFSDLTSEVIEVWEDTIKNAEKVEFNIRWVREWLEDVKIDFLEKEKLSAAFVEQDELLQAEKKKSIAAKNALEEAERNIAALKTKMSLLTKERRKYEEKDNHLLSQGRL